MDENYAVDLDELQLLTSRTESFTSLLQERVRAAEAAARTLPAWWTGPAADTFQLAHQDWVRSAERLIEEVAGLAASTRAAHEAYSAAFESNSNMLLQGRS